ncbi:hypothetical protein ACHAXH_007953 [Discostella pseudostelligera]
MASTARVAIWEPFYYSKSSGGFADQLWSTHPTARFLSPSTSDDNIPLNRLIYEAGKLVAVIGDEDTVTGFLLAGVGHRTADSCNFLTVKQDTKPEVIENTLKAFTQRDDIGIILINQHVANNLRHILKDYNQTIPTILEIPSKEHPYDPEQDFIMQRVNMFLGGGA